MAATTSAIPNTAEASIRAWIDPSFPGTIGRPLARDPDAGPGARTTVD